MHYRSSTIWAIKKQLGGSAGSGQRCTVMPRQSKIDYTPIIEYIDEFAMEEEIGAPEIFVGRRKELKYFLEWKDQVKRKIVKSTAILARRKSGKTALVQRLYNILYALNDPQVIPIYYRVGEQKTTELDYGLHFYLTLISQYLSYKHRTRALKEDELGFDALRELAGPDEALLKDIDGMEMLYNEGNGTRVWRYAAYAGERISIQKDERIIQILDEFQYINQYIYTERPFTEENQIDLCGTYQHVGSSKISPQIITGSQVGLLETIIGKMVARYDTYIMNNLPREEALAAVYNYSRLFNLEVTEESAAYIAELCHDDPFYIASLFSSKYEEKDMTDNESITRTMDYETEPELGAISRMWWEYIQDAFGRINAVNARRIVLYLAKYGGETRTRAQIKEDLKLEMEDYELEMRLHKLVKADIIAYGGSRFRLKGLGDRIFEVVYRKLYEEELKQPVTPDELHEELLKKLRSAQSQVSYHKGIAAEYRVRYRLLMAEREEIALEDLVYNHQPGCTLGPFASIRKRRFYTDQERSIEIDIYCEREEPDGRDLAVEVKDHITPLTIDMLKEFIAKRQPLEDFRKRPVGLLLYSEEGVNAEQAEFLKAHGVMYTDRERLG